MIKSSVMGCPGMTPYVTRYTEKSRRIGDYARHRVHIWPDLSHKGTFHNGTEAGRGRGANALGHPLNALAWLADQGVLGGRGLKAGDLVTTGLVTPFVYADAGDEVRADFRELGEARLRFTD